MIPLFAIVILPNSRMNFTLATLNTAGVSYASVHVLCTALRMSENHLYAVDLKVPERPQLIK